MAGLLFALTTLFFTLPDSFAKECTVILQDPSGRLYQDEQFNREFAQGAKKKGYRFVFAQDRFIPVQTNGIWSLKLAVEKYDFVIRFNGVRTSSLRNIAGSISKYDLIKKKQLGASPSETGQGDATDKRQASSHELVDTALSMLQPGCL